MPVKINGSTSGSTTITAPATGTDETIELSTALAAKLPIAGGKVLQTVVATYSTQTDSTSSTYADTGLTATITPSSATSKVLVLVEQAGVVKQVNNGVKIRLLRGATELAVFATEAGYNASATVYNSVHVGGAYLDSPATTSATTYKTQFASSVNTTFARVQASSSVSAIVLMEVSA